MPVSRTDANLRPVLETRQVSVVDSRPVALEVLRHTPCRAVKRFYVNSAVGTTGWPGSRHDRWCPVSSKIVQSRRAWPDPAVCLIEAGPVPGRLGLDHQGINGKAREPSLDAADHRTGLVQRLDLVRRPPFQAHDPGPEVGSKRAPVLLPVVDQRDRRHRRRYPAGHHDRWLTGPGWSVKLPLLAAIARPPRSRSRQPVPR